MVSVIKPGTPQHESLTAHRGCSELRSPHVLTDVLPPLPPCLESFTDGKGLMVCLLTLPGRPLAHPAFFTLRYGWDPYAEPADRPVLAGAQCVPISHTTARGSAVALQMLLGLSRDTKAQGIFGKSTLYSLALLLYIYFLPRPACEDQATLWLRVAHDLQLPFDSSQ